MGHGQGSQTTRLRRLKSIELLTKSFEFLVGGAWLPLSEDTFAEAHTKFLTKSIEFLADGAWPALSEDRSVEAPTNRTPHEINRIPCRRDMASALRRRVCGR